MRTQTQRKQRLPGRQLQPRPCRCVVRPVSPWKRGRGRWGAGLRAAVLGWRLGWGPPPRASGGPRRALQGRAGPKGSARREAAGQQAVGVPGLLVFSPGGVTVRSQAFQTWINEARVLVLEYGDFLQCPSGVGGGGGVGGQSPVKTNAGPL